MEMMPEAEVSIRLAFWLAERGLARGRIEIAIDGAQVRTGTTTHFDLGGFLLLSGWRREQSSGGWQGTYRHADLLTSIQIHSNPGKGDVVALLNSGRTIRAECKKGPLVRSASSAEYPLIREALGQLLTVSEVSDRDILAVAVPHSEKFAELAARWSQAPLIKRFGIQILTVDRKGNVEGFVENGAVERANAADEALAPSHGAGVSQLIRTVIEPASL